MPSPASVDIGSDTVILRSQGHEILFPRPWARKFAAWLREGRSRNVVCNADPQRFNLLGATRAPGGILLTFLEGGQPQALLLTLRDLEPLISGLAAEE